MCQKPNHLIITVNLRIMVGEKYLKKKKKINRYANPIFRDYTSYYISINIQEYK